jgi:hypothetical protein
MIDLKLYLDGPTRDAIAELYALCRWDFEPSWEWPFKDVCALYFRVCMHRESFASVGLVLMIETAAHDYMEDEFA